MTTGACDVVVVGGGLGGLAAATLLARRGLDVVVAERATSFGGRAATHDRGGFLYNEGAHALYRRGAAARVLGRLGVRSSGHRPPDSGLAVRDARTYALPATPTSLLTTGLLGWGSKTQGARLFARLGRHDLVALAGVPWDEWLARTIPDAPMRAAIEAFVRVTTYANVPRGLSAGAVLGQLRLARGGVDYLDGGWGTLVAGLSEAARTAGARLVAASKAARATPDGPTAGARWRVTLGDASLACRAVVLATGPEAARSLVSSDALDAWASEAVPARAACLDVALSRLPAPATTFALGVDVPLYFSVHSRTARLAPEGAALVSTMKYLSTATRSDPAADLAELEAWLDLLQPGWRDCVVDRRWLPSMVASNAVVLAHGRGLAGRPGPSVPGAPGLFAVGDWVGAEGMLLDASLASAERVADELAGALAAQQVA